MGGRQIWWEEEETQWEGDEVVFSRAVQSSDPENTFVCHCAIQQVGEAGTWPQGQSLSVIDLAFQTSQAVCLFH